MDSMNPPTNSQRSGFFHHGAFGTLDPSQTLTMTTWYVIASIWVMQVMGFTMPKTSEATSWEVLDLVKTGILAFTCLLGAFSVWRLSLLRSFWRVAAPLVPFGVFFVFALISTLWSPLKSVTIAQSGGLASLLLLSVTTGVLARDRNRASLIFRHLNGALLASSFVVLVTYLIDPTISGLDRQRIHSGGDGIIHPTAAGATASLGLLLPVLCHFLGKLQWAKATFVPCGILHGSILFLSNSRTAILMALVTIGVVLYWYSTRWQRAKLLGFAGLALFAMVLIDPGFQIAEKTLGASAQYVTRGQSGDQIKAASGRAEMWSAIWQEYNKSMVFGHGYFVTSETGKLDVWNHVHNHTAHNLILQILASTGALGLLVFGMAIARVVLTISGLRSGDVVQRRIFFILAISGIWYLGWAQFGVSFMGPVRPESIYFFVLLGIGLGQAAGLGKKSNSDQNVNHLVGSSASP